jgi:hypothetical protein
MPNSREAAAGVIPSAERIGTWFRKQGVGTEAENSV